MGAGVTNPGCCACTTPPTGTVLVQFNDCFSALRVGVPIVIYQAGVAVASGTTDSAGRINVSTLPRGLAYTATSTSFVGPRYTGNVNAPFTIPSSPPSDPYTITGVGFAVTPGYVCFANICGFPLSNRMNFHNGGTGGDSTGVYNTVNWKDSGGNIFSPTSPVATYNGSAGSSGTSHTCSPYSFAFVFGAGAGAFTVTVTEATPVP